MTDSFDWNALKAFLAVARAGRLTTAAGQLGIDHSTLSRRISELEAALGGRLFERRVTGYTLTPQGERLLASAQPIESLALAAMNDIAGSAMRAAGTVRIGAPDGFGSMFLARRLGRLNDENPDLLVELVTRPWSFSLANREADIAITMAQPREGKLHSRKLTDYSIGLFGSKKYVAKHGAPKNPGELKDRRLIGFMNEFVREHGHEYNSLVPRGLQFSLFASNVVSQLEMAVADLGFCFLPCYMAAMDNRLQRVLKQHLSLTRTFWLVLHSDTRDLGRIRTTSEFIVREVKASRALFMPQD